MITVVLVEPEHPGNIGSVCRVMANFGFKELILINPQCNPHDQAAHNLAKNAQEILNNARIADWSVLEEFPLIAATTGIIGTDYNLVRTPLMPEVAAEKLVQVKKAALLFGRESNGLTTKELRKADFVIHVPTHHDYTSMNLSHCVAVMLYTIYRQKPHKQFTPIPATEKRILEEKLRETLNELPFRNDAQKRTQEKFWENVFGRAMLTKREAFVALGFLSAIRKQRTLQPKVATKRTPVRRKSSRAKK
jgi:tRNA/rRNA methyltransferase